MRKELLFGFSIMALVVVMVEVVILVVMGVLVVVVLKVFQQAQELLVKVTLVELALFYRGIGPVGVVVVLELLAEMLLV